MHFEKIQEITFQKDSLILHAALLSATQVVMLLNDGKVVLYTIGAEQTEYLLDTKNITSTTGAFDPTTASSFYSLGGVVVLVNDFGKCGAISYPSRHRPLHLYREDYYARLSKFPIALFKSPSGVPHIIYAVAWNHLHIMNLDTRQILTAAKSLIEERAEEKHINFYKEHAEDNKLPWPRHYDYFFGELLMSPDDTKFLSRGWVWGSADCLKVYEVEDFINNPRIRDKTVGYWEHAGRPACWLDNSTVVVAFNMYEEGETGYTTETLCELHFYDVAATECVITKQVTLQVPFGITDLYYFREADVFVIQHKDMGLLLCTTCGEILHRDSNIKPTGFFPTPELIVALSGNTISIYGIARR